jgi:hypothetical protein
MAASPHIQHWAHSVPLALAAYSYTRFRLPGCWRWHLTAVRCGQRQRSESNRVASCHSFPILPSWLLSLEFLNGGTRP